MSDAEGCGTTPRGDGRRRGGMDDAEGVWTTPRGYGRRRGGVDDAEDEAAIGSGGRPCPLCETPMYHRHCKYVCPAHGVVYDCSDTFY